MPEDAFERFRRLRAVSHQVSAGAQSQPPADPAPMSPLALLKALHACGVRLIPDPDGTLRYAGHADALSPALVDQVHMHTAALHDLVEAFEERAAIAEYCGGLSRMDAERLAWQDIGEEQTP